MLPPGVETKKSAATPRQLGGTNAFCKEGVLFVKPAGDIYKKKTSSPLYSSFLVFGAEIQGHRICRVTDRFR